MKYTHRIASMLLLFAVTTTNAQIAVPAAPDVKLGTLQATPASSPSKVIVHWYALENEHNPLYWEDAKLDRILICLNTGVQTMVIKPLIDKYGLVPTKDSSMFPVLMNFYIYSIPNPSKEKMLQIIRDAKTNPDVQFAEPDIWVEPTGCVPNDPYYYPVKQYAPYEVGADSAWCTVYRGFNNLVGIIDDAVDYNHADLLVRYGYDFADGDANPGPDAAQNQRHGTHVTGIAAANANNGIGIAGLASDTTYFAKVSLAATGQLSNVAIVNALNQMSQYSQIRVINMSFRSKTNDAVLEAACQNAWNAGKLLVAASGNDTASYPVYPAAYNTTLAIGSVTHTYTLAPYSNYGTNQTLVAPGGDGDGGLYDIYSTVPGNAYDYMAGTSMAAPVVTGVAELMFDINPNLTNTQAKWVLENNVYVLDPNGWDQTFGYGMVCAWCAVYGAQHYTAAQVNEIATGTVTKVYPNPNTGTFSIDLSSFNGGSVHGYISDMMGKIVWEYKEANTPARAIVTLQNAANGVYMLHLQSASRQLNEKILVNLN